jgi:hypothetical protein
LISPDCVTCNDMNTVKTNDNFLISGKVFILAVTTLLFNRLVCQTIIHLEFINEIRRANLKMKSLVFNLTMYFQIYF